MRRNRAAVVAAGVLLLSLAAGFAGTLWQARVARQERATAEQRFNDARKLANYLLFDLYDSLGKVPGTLPMQADMARRALQYLDRLAATKNTDPVLREELAEGYLRLGTVFGPSGARRHARRYRQAIASDRKALAIAEPLVKRTPGPCRGEAYPAGIEGQLGGALSMAGQFDEAITGCEKRLRPSSRSPPPIRRMCAACGMPAPPGDSTARCSAKRAVISVSIRTRLWRICASRSANLKAALHEDAANPETIGCWPQLRGHRTGSIQLQSDEGVQAYTTALELLARLPGPNSRAWKCGNCARMMLVLVGWGQGQLGDFKHALANLEEARPILDA